MLDLSKNYIHLFNTEDEYLHQIVFDHWKPFVSYTKEIDEVNYNDPFIFMPLTIGFLEDGYLNWKQTGTTTARTIEYSRDKGETWTEVTSTAEGTHISVSSGDILYIRAENASYANENGANTFSGTTAQFVVCGNLNSLLSKTHFIEIEELTEDYAFTSLFYGCDKLLSVKNLHLPATTLTTACYTSMFAWCINNEEVFDILPAMAMEERCYNAMFYHNEKITRTPKLPATQLAMGCYQTMFEGCHSLTDEGLPELPALEVPDTGYYCMFEECRTLTRSPYIPATYVGPYGMWRMFAACTNLVRIDCDAITSSGSKSFGQILSGNYMQGTLYQNPDTQITWSNRLPYTWTVVNRE